jgi:hypothetical protein
MGRYPEYNVGRDLEGKAEAYLTILLPMFT